MMRRCGSTQSYIETHTVEEAQRKYAKIIACIGGGVGTFPSLALIGGTESNESQMSAAARTESESFNYP